jgi:hypothetical protein
MYSSEATSTKVGMLGGSCSTVSSPLGERLDQRQHRENRGGCWVRDAAHQLVQKQAGEADLSRGSAPAAHDPPLSVEESPLQAV